MDSFEVIRADDVSSLARSLLDKVEPVPDSESEAVWRCVKMAQALQDHWQLYQMFCWNYDRFAEGLKCRLNDVVSTNAHCSSREDFFERTWADVNCYATNLISAGITLVEALRAFVKAELNENEDVIQFESYLNSLFDKHGVYALFSKLRNAAQHGQPLVSVYVDSLGEIRAAFDMDQLASPEHYDTSGTYREIVDEKITQMDELDAHHHRVSYSQCMELFNLNILKIVDEFYKIPFDFVRNAFAVLSRLFKEHPECFGRLPTGESFVWMLRGDEAHPFCGVEKSVDELWQERRSRVTLRLDAAIANYKIIMNAFCHADIVPGE